MHAQYRKRKTFIAKLAVDDRTITNHEGKDEAIWDFYNSFLGTPGSHDATLNLDTIGLQVHDLSSLDVPITEEKVWDTVKNLKLDKAPVPDGFTGRFYKSCWEIVKLDVMATIGALYGGDARKLHLLNSTLLVLIPKKEEALHVGDYHPISLVYSFAKLVAKIMANRLCSHLGNMISLNQRTLIKGCNIHDNFY